MQFDPPPALLARLDGRQVTDRIYRLCLCWLPWSTGSKHCVKLSVFLPEVRPGDLQTKGTTYGVGSDQVLLAGRLSTLPAEQFERLSVCY